MTDATTDTPDSDEPEDPGEPDGADAGDQPSIDDDEMADLSAIADDVHDASTDDTEEDASTVEDESTESDTDDDSESLTTPSSTSTSTASRSWGKMYTKGVVKASEVIIDEFGDEDADPITEADVQDLELDDAFDEWMATKTGRPEDIPPGQWVALGTILLLGGNALTETDLAQEALSNGI